MSKFCPAPWINISTDVNGSVRPCCYYAQPKSQKGPKIPFMHEQSLKDIFEGPEFTQIRQQFLDGEQPEDCYACWAAEDAGVSSYRQGMIKKANTEGIDLTVPTATMPTRWDFKLSSVCNLKCINCNHTASSSIYKELRAAGQKTYDDKTYKYFLSDKVKGTENEQYFKDNLKNCEFIELTGGEPFSSPENIWLIQQVIDSGYAKNINLGITTNGTFYIPRVIEMLKQFRYVHIAISLDDIEHRVEYSRFGTDWEKISENIDKYQQLMIDTGKQISTFFTCTVGWMNVFYLEEYINYIEKRWPHITYGVTPLWGPVYLNISHLPDEVKEEVSKKLTHPRWQGIKNYMNKQVDQSIVEEAVYKFIKHQGTKDTLRGNNFKETYPEFYEHLEFFFKVYRQGINIWDIF
jgi:MoaA/NifB/PqqE/SkfB family radical SAM enzyme